MSPAAPILVSLLLGLWPFADDKPAEDPSVGTLGDGEQIVVEDTPVSGSATRARQHYARYLEMEADSAPELRAVALRRLADLTLEEGETLSAEGDVDQATVCFVRSAALYRQFLREFPDDQAVPAVRYQLARALAMSGDESGSQDELMAIVSDPASDGLEAEAWFRRGEALFSAQRWQESAAAYRNVLAQPVGDFHEQATYKLGWSLFKQGLHDESLGYFFDVLDDRLVSGDQIIDVDTLEHAQRELVNDSLRAIAIGFSYNGGPAGINDYLATRAVSDVYAPILFDRLGALYLDQERYQDAADSFSSYVSAHPLAEDAPAMQMRVAEAYGEGGFPDLVLQAKRDFAARFGIAGGYWETRDPEALPEAWAHLRQVLDELAEHYHAAARVNASPPAVAESIHWYRVWLNTFPTDPGAARRQFLLGELLFDSRRFGEAAEAYERAAYDFGSHEHAAEAGHAAVLARREVIGEDRSPEAEARFIESALRFAEGFPAHPESVAARLEASRRLFDAGQFAAALEHAETVAANPETGVEQRKSALLISGHSAFDLAEYGRAETAYAALIPLTSEAAERDPLLDRLAASIYRQGEEAAAAGFVDEAVAHFSRVAGSAPGSEIAAAADYDLAVLLMQSGQWSEAENALRTFRSRYPGHEYQDQVTVSLVSVLTETGDESGAANELLAVAELETQPDEVRRAAQWQAAELFETTAAEERAIEAWSKYVQRYPEPLDPAMEARSRLAALHGDRGDPAGRLRWLQAMVDADSQAAERTERSRTLAAESAVELADVKRHTYQALALSAPLEQTLPAKKASMEAALESYALAADYGIAGVVTRATYRIAQIYREFGRSLMQSERPAGLDAETLEQYEILLEEQAFPFEEKAIEIHESNIARARGGLYDQWVVMSFEALANLVPARYARNEMGEELVYRLY